jgi:hypothetical protein
VHAEIKLSERIMKEIKLSVDPEALVEEVLPEVRDALINAYYARYMTHIFAARPTCASHEWFPPFRAGVASHAQLPPLTLPTPWRTAAAAQQA